jgi:hypothetical protein
MTEELMLELWHKAGGDIYVYADLVAEKEREACAKVCEEYDNGRHANFADLCADAIRARGQE